MLRRQRAIEIVPSSKSLRWRRYDVPQHLAPETSDALRFCAVEGDLDLLDRRHRSTIEGDPAIAARVAVSRDMGWRPARGRVHRGLRKNHETCQDRARRSPIAPPGRVPETGLSLMEAVLPTGNRDHAESKEKEGQRLGGMHDQRLGWRRARDEPERSEAGDH